MERKTHVPQVVIFEGNKEKVTKDYNDWVMEFPNTPHKAKFSMYKDGGCAIAVFYQKRHSELYKKSY